MEMNLSYLNHGLEVLPVKLNQFRLAHTSQGVSRNSLMMSTLQITELPVGTWTEKYIEFLNKISVERGKETAKNFVRSFRDNSTETQVDITIKINPINLNKWKNKFGKDGV